MEIAQKRKRKPRLRRAMFRLYASHFIIDGFKCFSFIFIRLVFFFFIFLIIFFSNVPISYP